jgi:hypothetical protein
MADKMIEKLGVSKDGLYTKYKCSCGINFNVYNGKTNKTIKRIKMLRCKKCEALSNKIANRAIAKFRDCRADIQEFKDTIDKYCNSADVYEQ